MRTRNAQTFVNCEAHLPGVQAAWLSYQSRVRQGSLLRRCTNCYRVWKTLTGLSCKCNRWRLGICQSRAVIFLRRQAAGHHSFETDRSLGALAMAPAKTKKRTSQVRPETASGTNSLGRAIGVGRSFSRMSFITRYERLMHSV